MSAQSGKILVGGSDSRRLGIWSELPMTPKINPTAAAAKHDSDLKRAFDVAVGRIYRRQRQLAPRRTAL
jgi:hypothetical protein